MKLFEIIGVGSRWDFAQETRCFSVVDVVQPLITKLMGKGEAASRRELMELHGDSVEINV